jgi:hypothetical protein
MRARSRETQVRPLSRDTSPEAERILIEGYRRMSPAQKLRQVQEAAWRMRELVLADVRRRHPNADARECALRAASRWISADLMRKAFGWDPEKEGY